MTLACVFPGQGSQSVGMLAELAANHPIVGHTFAEASAALGYDLWQRVSTGPAEKLDQTECTQPAMLVAGVATWRAWVEQGGARPAFVAGHSLGEFTALVCAGVMDFVAAVTLVRDRGRYMQSAVPAGGGGMAAILGLEDAAVEAVCVEAAHGEVVQAVNYNAPGQVVIAGQAAAVERAIAAALSHGAKRALLLPVSVPAHSALMEGAAAQLRERLAAIALSAPAIDYLSAVDAQLHRDPEDIRALLVRQLASAVRWTAAVEALSARGVHVIVECGPGKVLTSLNKRITKSRDTQCLAIENQASLRAALDATGSTTR
ncbi:MAG: ACP S-malonyltransferase [Steroidobacteraceae bacterium]